MTARLVTAFEPFGGMAENSSQWVLEEVLKHAREEDQVRGLVLPVIYDAAPERVIDVLGEEDFGEIVMLGMAGPEPKVRIEQSAINRVGASKADNAGDVRAAGPIEIAGADVMTPAYPRNELVRHLARAKIPAEISTDPGRFVCNYTYYRVACALIEGGDPWEAPSCIFIHVPAPLGVCGPGGWNREDAARFAVSLLDWLRIPKA